MTPSDGEQPLYLRIAEGLKQQVADGTLAEGSRLPSEQKLAETWDAGRPTVRQALDALRREGVVVTQPNRGTFVRRTPPVQIRSSSRYRRPTTAGGETSPFANDADRSQAHPDWAWQTERVRAQEDIAARLGIATSDYVMRTRYVFTANGVPAQSSTSWEPYELVGGTPIEEPEGDGKIIGVIARMDSIGVNIDRVSEVVRARAATPAERFELQVPGDTWVLAIDRTHWATDHAVETATIVIPADRFALEYDIPIA